ncbi:MAG: FAD-dependent oxidoreductase, partial [Actinomycetota bacterium]
MTFPTTVSAAARASLADLRFVPYWLDTPDRPAARPALTSDIQADLAVVGGGFSGLWTAYLATERFPDWTVVVLEGDRIASGATGRNGGFIASS